MGSTKYLPNIIFPLYRTYVIYILVNQNSVKLLFGFFKMLCFRYNSKKCILRLLLIIVPLTNSCIPSFGIDFNSNEGSSVMNNPRISVIITLYRACPSLELRFQILRHTSSLDSLYVGAASINICKNCIFVPVICLHSPFHKNNSCDDRSIQVLPMSTTFFLNKEYTE